MLEYLKLRSMEIGMEKVNHIVKEMIDLRIKISNTTLREREILEKQYLDLQREKDKLIRAYNLPLNIK
jgi:hypothetical protein